jgi:hypothetical protein
MTLTSGDACASIRARAVVAAHIKRLANRSASAHIDRFGVILPSLPWNVRGIAAGLRQATVQSEVTAFAIPHFRTHRTPQGAHNLLAPLVGPREGGICIEQMTDR